LGAIYTFKNFTELTEQESDEVLWGRNDGEVRRWMDSNKIISLKEHNDFLVSLKSSTNRTYLRVERNGHFVGVYSLNELNNSSAVGGFWVSAYARQRLLSICIVFQSVYYVFKTFPIEKIHGFQLINNKSVAKLNTMLGFIKSALPADIDSRMDYLELTRQIWVASVLPNHKLRTIMETAERTNED
jgi:UDP-4-amino-4,6-dideoxy-N-acetyl-beta-L-altrosamine N-acetyltransferase